MAFFGDGLAVGPDLESAARQAVEQALAPLSGPPSLVCVFVRGGPTGRADAAAAGGCRGDGRCRERDRPGRLLVTRTRPFSAAPHRA